MKTLTRKTSNNTQGPLPAKIAYTTLNSDVCHVTGHAALCMHLLIKLHHCMKNTFVIFGCSTHRGWKRRFKELGITSNDQFWLKLLSLPKTVINAI